MDGDWATLSRGPALQCVFRVRVRVREGVGYSARPVKDLARKRPSLLLHDPPPSPRRLSSSSSSFSRAAAASAHLPPLSPVPLPPLLLLLLPTLARLGHRVSSGRHL